jgi:hypothetical protein
MEMIRKYLENTTKFRNLAAAEKQPDVQALLEKQADAYRKLAEERAKKLNLPMPGSTAK